MDLGQETWERNSSIAYDCDTHTWGNKMAEESSEKMTGEATEDEPFKAVPVKRKRKRQKEEDMDTSDESKRPSFPPAKAEKLMVNFDGVRLLLNEVSSFNTNHRIFPRRVERQRLEKYLFPHTDIHL